MVGPSVRKFRFHFLVLVSRFAFRFAGLGMIFRFLTFYSIFLVDVALVISVYYFFFVVVGSVSLMNCDYGFRIGRALVRVKPGFRFKR